MAANRNKHHEEVWDDSLLVNSWNDAVEEYKRYHSIQARGEDVEEVLEAHEYQRHALREEKVDYEEEAKKQPSHDHLSDNSLPVDSDDHNIKDTSTAPQVKDKPLNLSQARDSGSPQAPALPQHLIGQVHDDSLKNLLMSWYYAGYYTGLHEGKQQQMDAKHKV